MYNIKKINSPIVDENEFITFDTDGKGVSRVYDDFWDFSGHGERLKNCQFTKIPQEHHVNIKKYIFSILNHKKNINITKHIPVSKIIQWRDCLNYIIRAWGQSEFSLLSNDREWRAAKSGLKGKYSQKTLNTIASTINSFNDAGLINRYVERSEIHALSSSKKQKQHIAFPPAIHAQILEKVINKIEKYYDHRHEISNVMQQSIELYDTMLLRHSEVLNAYNTHNIKIFNKKYYKARNNNPPNHNIPDFKLNPINGAWVRTILINCLIAVGLFSGARRNELLSMQPDSYKVINCIPVLQGKSSKSNQGVPIPEIWVTHPIVKKALELAYDMTQYSREIHNEYLTKSLSERLISKDHYNRLTNEINSVFITVEVGRTFYNKIHENLTVGVHNLLETLEG